MCGPWQRGRLQSCGQRSHIAAQEHQVKYIRKVNARAHTQNVGIHRGAA